MMTIGKRLRQLRENSGLTQPELAEKLGVNQSTITRYENGTKIPTLPVAIQMADIFGCSLDSLVERRCS